uniref:phosphoethanolamine N-methyltransferase n=1 Tax=Callorhinchus milii TaxID=7868 RepID=V9KTI7_CALMI
MLDYWKQHSQEATVEEMMLDSCAKIIAREERPEILSMLPDVDGRDVLELGAGIGRFTGQLSKIARHVTAVDFMEKFIQKNRESNGFRGNVTFLHADITALALPPHSFDLIFSNWLFMYLSDEELHGVTQKMVSWLRPGGYLFFRESCFHQSGDAKRSFNPTKYRKPADYNHILTSVSQSPPEPQGTSCGLEIVMSKSVQAYIKLKRNQYQVCWLLQKIQRNRSANLGFETFQKFLDNSQYSRVGILRYEKVFGRGFVSTGGLETTKEFVTMLKLEAGQQVLDVGCGIGGGDFYMAKTCGVEVLGMDLSSNMVEIAMERALEEDTKLVQFEIADATKRNFPEHSFDVVYSRDTILHIADKPALFRKFYEWLKPGGKLLVTDYCCGERPWTEIFEAYVKQRNYNLQTVRVYAQVLEGSGFVRVQALDRTDQFVGILNRELERIRGIQSEFVQEFSEQDYDCIVSGWRQKLHRCALGEQRWGVFYAEKPETDGAARGGEVGVTPIPPVTLTPTPQ